MSLWQKFQIIHITSKHGPIRTLFEKSWLWVINLALRTRTPGGRVVGSMRTTADKGQKLAKCCGRLLWMAPNINNTMHITYMHGVNLAFTLYIVQCTATCTTYLQLQYLTHFIGFGA